MDYKMKQLVVDSIFKVMNNSPIKINNNSNVTKDRFDIWVNYALSMLNIFNDNNSILMEINTTKNKIISITSMNSDDYLNKTLQINQVLLDLPNCISFCFLK